jgi:hypothetical protein
MSKNANYSNTSPYYNTPMYGKFLDLSSFRKITKLSTDKLYSIDRFYHLRPDILAYDLYQTPSLWWVFAARNPNSIKDPLFDFVAGNLIYLPDKTTLISDLGL